MSMSSDKSAIRIGIAGLGKMGSAMAARLQEAGDDVAVWNRSRAKAQATGLLMTDTPSALAERSDVIISTLFDESAIDAVYNGADGLLVAARGKLFIEMSTVRPMVQQALASAVMQAGGAFIECPVGGTTGPARSGQLLGLAGGKASDVERARPVLEKLCRRVEHMGPIGAGATAKLAINLPLLAFWQSFGEAMALIRHLGKDPAWLVELFSETAGGPNILKAKAKALAATLAGDDTVEPTFDIDSMRKDLRMMLREGETRGIALPVAGQTLTAFDEASAAGLGGKDCAYMPAYWARNPDIRPESISFTPARLHPLK
jgi:3-hydroxyisobutyrate dehydrogenase